MTQKERVLNHLKANNSINPMEALGQYGIMRLAAIVFDLKCQGHNIMAERKTVTNRYGDDCQIAFYKLIGE